MSRAGDAEKSRFDDITRRHVWWRDYIAHVDALSLIRRDVVSVHSVAAAICHAGITPHVCSYSLLQQVRILKGRFLLFGVEASTIINAGGHLGTIITQHIHRYSPPVLFNVVLVVAVQDSSIGMMDHQAPLNHGFYMTCTTLCY